MWQKIRMELNFLLNMFHNRSIEYTRSIAWSVQGLKRWDIVDAVTGLPKNACHRPHRDRCYTRHVISMVVMSSLVWRTQLQHSCFAGQRFNFHNCEFCSKLLRFCCYKNFKIILVLVFVRSLQNTNNQCRYTFNFIHLSH